MPRDGSNVYHRPSGIDAVTNTTISSVAYNTNVQDVESDLNLPRPIVAGGTGANNAATAMANLGGELAKQSVSNYDATVFQAGSFYSTTSATGAPVAGHAFNGICYVTDANNMTVEARDQTTGNKYARIMTAGVWGTWSPDSGSGQFVLKAGDTMTGNLTVNTAGGASVALTPTSGSAAFALNKATATDANNIWGSTAGSARWSMQLGNVAAESGSNVGSDFGLNRYNDTGAIIDSPLIINRSSGNATFTQALSANGLITAGANQASGYVYFGNQNKYLYSDGTNYAFGSGGVYLNGLLSVPSSLTVGNGISLNGSLTCTNCNITGVNGVYCNGVDVQGGSVQHATVYYFGTDNGVYFNDDRANGRIGTNQNLHTIGYLQADNYVQANAFVKSLTGRVIAQTNDNASVSVYSTGRGACGSMWLADQIYFGWADGGGNPSQGIMNVTTSYFQIAGGTAYKPGGGAWAATSDARIKNVLGNYTSGLDAVAALQPVRYTYIGNDTRDPPSTSGMGVVPDDSEPKEEPTIPYPNSGHYVPAKDGTEFIGLIAQPTELVMPELVSQAEGYINGEAVSDIRMLDTTPLIFALINAIKELKAKVEALEAR